MEKIIIEQDTPSNLHTMVRNDIFNDDYMLNLLKLNTHYFEDCFNNMFPSGKNDIKNFKENNSKFIKKINDISEIQALRKKDSTIGTDKIYYGYRSLIYMLMDEAEDVKHFDDMFIYYSYLFFLDRRLLNVNFWNPYFSQKGDIDISLYKILISVFHRNDIKIDGYKSLVDIDVNPYTAYEDKRIFKTLNPKETLPKTMNQYIYNKLTQAKQKIAIVEIKLDLFSFTIFKNMILNLEKEGKLNANKVKQFLATFKKIYISEMNQSYLKYFTLFLKIAYKYNQQDNLYTIGIIYKNILNSINKSEYKDENIQEEFKKIPKEYLTFYAENIYELINNKEVENNIQMTGKLIYKIIEINCEMFNLERNYFVQSLCKDYCIKRLRTIDYKSIQVKQSRHVDALEVMKLHLEFCLTLDVYNSPKLHKLFNNELTKITKKITGK